MERRFEALEGPVNNLVVVAFDGAPAPVIAPRVRITTNPVVASTADLCPTIRSNALRPRPVRPRLFPLSIDACQHPRLAAALVPRSARQHSVTPTHNSLCVSARPASRLPKNPAVPEIAMRSFDFSSWQGILTTLGSLAIITLIESAGNPSARHNSWSGLFRRCASACRPSQRSQQSDP